VPNAMRRLFRCAVLIWGTIPLLTLAAFMRWFPESIVSFYGWRFLAFTWAFSFLTMCCLIIKYGMGSRSFELLSMLCTISLGLPAIALGALPVTGLTDWSQSPRSEEKISLKNLLPEEGGSLPVVYIVGLDVSGSFSGKDKQMGDALLRLFGHGGTVGAAMQPRDHYEVLAFSEGKPERLLEGEGAMISPVDGPPGRDELLRRLATGMLGFDHKTLKDTMRGRQERLDFTRTDVLGFISQVCATLAREHTREHKYRGARLLVISDFMQSPPREGQQLSEKMDNLFKLVGTIPNLSIVAFKSEPARRGPADIDVLPMLREALSPVAPVQEVLLDRFLVTTDEAEQVARPNGLIADAGPPIDCSLVPPAIKDGPKKLLLEIPSCRDFDELYFELSVGRDETAPVTVRIPDCDGPTLGGVRTLDPDPGNAKYCKLKRCTSPLEIEVNRGKPWVVADARGALKVVVPKRNQMGTVNLSVARGGSSAVYQSLISVLAILNLLPLVLSVVMFRHAKPMPADSGQSGSAAGGSARPRLEENPTPQPTTVGGSYGVQDT